MPRVARLPPDHDREIVAPSGVVALIGFLDRTNEAKA
jgi:hypothetical protein